MVYGTHPGTFFFRYTSAMLCSDRSDWIEFFTYTSRCLVRFFSDGGECSCESRIHAPGDCVSCLGLSVAHYFEMIQNAGTGLSIICEQNGTNSNHTLYVWEGRKLQIGSYPLVWIPCFVFFCVCHVHCKMDVKYGCSLVRSWLHYKIRLPRPILKRRYIFHNYFRITS